MLSLIRTFIEFWFNFQLRSHKIYTPKGFKLVWVRMQERILKYMRSRFPINKTKHRRSYMSAHVLLNLINKLGKIDKMRGLPNILSPFHNAFNIFNNTRSQMLNFNLSYDI